MFDGNYRTGRRQVDLSGGGRRRKVAAAASASGGRGAGAAPGTIPSAPAAPSDGGSRAALLGEARRLREERARHLERNRSAAQIQRAYRGHRSRRILAARLESELSFLFATAAAKSSPGPQHKTAAGTELERQTKLLNVWLSLPHGSSSDDDPAARRPRLRRQGDGPAVLRMLRAYASCVRAGASEAPAAMTKTGGAAASLLNPPPPLAHRIVQATFRSLLSPSSSAPASGRLAPADAGAIASHAIPTSSSLSSSLLAPAEMLRQMGGARGWVLLLEALQALRRDGGGKSGDGEDGCADDQGPEATASQRSESQQLQSELWRMAVAAAPPTASGGAALAVVALGPTDDSAGPPLDAPSSPETLRAWFSSLVQVLSSRSPSAPPNFAAAGGASTPPPTSDPIADAVVRMHPRASAAILRSATRLFRSSPGTASPASLPSPAPLLRYLLLLPGPVLAVASFLVRGDDDGFDWGAWRGGAAAAASSSQRAAGEREEEDDDDESDPDEADRSRVRAAASSGADRRFKSSGSSSRLTKQDLQTLTKIDRSYFQAVRAWRTFVLDELKRDHQASGDAVVEQARELCDPDEWLRWGKALFLSRGPTTDGAILAQEAYVGALAALLQSATGLRARDSVGSRFLGVLALDAAFVEHLWRYAMVQLANNSAQHPSAAFQAMSVFCDVFSHRLLAMRDSHFLRDYTTAHGRACVISAEHVIVKLRDMLYELYWTRPVRAKDVVPPGYVGSSPAAFGASADARELHSEAVRGRLLLTGTKLWQSLYERWCRLVRQAPFCDESAWWFPHVTTLSSEDTVVGVGGGGGLHNGGAEDMDLDASDDDEDGNSRAEPMSVDVESEALADAFSDPKMARVLTSVPQALAFERRVKLFHSLLSADKLKTQDEDADMRNAMLMAMRGEDGEWSSRERVSIRRDHLYDDSMRQLNRLGPKLRKKVQVSFINQYGQAEAGIDGGGVFKEFVDDLIKDAFLVDSSASLRLFSVTPMQTLAVNARLPPDATLLNHYEFLGRVLGKAVYESILVEPQFCLPFLNQLLGKTNSLEDLKNFDYEFYQNLTKLLSMPPEEIDGLGLTFELTLDDEGARAHTVELVGGGRTKPVTKVNVIQYVHLVAHQRLNVESSAQTRAFLRGFRDLIPAAWVRLFSAYELQKMISGDDSIRGIDVGALKRAMQYAAGYHPAQPVVHWFWEILEEMSAEQQRLFLRFMTSCSRQPLLGFASLEPAPCIQQIRLPEGFAASVNADKNAPLPTSSTCMNLLKLPNYWSKELMRRKMLAAIESGAGFELT